MEHKIGEIITLPDGRKVEVVEWDKQSERCEGCIFYEKLEAPYRERCLSPNILVKCSKIFRTDNKNIIYKEIKGGLIMAIEERAEEYLHREHDYSFTSGQRLLDYKAGATEQQKIDMSAFSIAFCDHFCSQAKRISCDAKGTTCTALASFLKQAMEE